MVDHSDDERRGIRFIGSGEGPGPDILFDPRTDPAPAQISPATMEALTFVQADLNACGLARYCMQLVTSGTDVDGVPEVMAATSDGSFWGGSSYRVEYLAEQVADALWTVAASVQDTLLEVERVIFPACAKHGGRPAEPGIPLPADGWPE